MKQITPRPYFSYSQMSSYKWSKQRFLETYYYGKRQESVYLDMGKKLGEALQFRKVKRSKVIEKIKAQIPPSDIYEKELKVNFKKIPLLGFADGWDKDCELVEYKTGKKPSESSWRNQMKFYSLMIYLLTKKLPKKITLYWCRTKFNENEQLILTGDVKKHDIKIELGDIIVFSAEITKVWGEIKDLCELEYNQFGILPKNIKKK